MVRVVGQAGGRPACLACSSWERWEEMGLPRQREVTGVAAVNSVKQHTGGGFRWKLKFLFFPSVLLTNCVPGLSRC